MDYRLLGIVLVLLVAGFLLTPRGSRPGEGMFPIIGRRAPEFTLSGLGEFSTSHARGKPFIVAFWATWCRTCKHDLVVLEEFHRLHGDRVGVVGICPDRWREVPAIVAERGITFPIVYDPGAGVTHRYQLSDNLRYPFTAFVNERGEVAGVWVVTIRDLDHLLELISKSGIVIP